jgi:hypothetical protein
MYQPEPVTSLGDLPDLAAYIGRELSRIAEALPGDYLVIKVYHNPPAKVKEGMLVFADGTNWDPGSGRGLYLYDGGWQKV